MARLDITHLAKSFGPMNVLSDVNLHIESGEFVVFVGPSGCGKSTLLRIISGLETMSSGQLRINGTLMNDVDPAQRGTAMVFQSYALYPHMTAAENMGFSLRMARETKPTILDKVMKAAAILRLDALLERRPSQLSGGQKQRVAIGRAIVRQPKVFLFDEPLSNLDAELRVRMRAELIDLHRRLGATMIYVTHDQVEAMTLADKMVVMNGGVVQQFGAPLDLYDDPGNRFVAGFIGSPKMNFLKARIAVTGPGRVTVSGIGGSGAAIELPFPGFDPALSEIEIGIRPEHVRLAPEGAAGPHDVEADVAFVEELGDVTYIHADMPGGERLIVRSDGLRYRGGRTCRARLDPGRFLLFDATGRRIRPIHAH